MGELAKAACLHGFADVLHRPVEPVLMTDTHLQTAGPGGVDDLIRLLQRQGHGFFNEHMTAGFQTVQGDPGMAAGVGGNGDKVGMFPFQHGVMIRVYGYPLQFELPDQPDCCFRIQIAKGCDFQAVVSGCLNMIGRDSSTANQCILHFDSPVHNTEETGFASPKSPLQYALL